MLSAKPWKADAIIRLGLSVIVCVFAGSLFLSVQHYVSAGAKVSPKLFFPLTAAALGCLAATLILISKPWPLESFSRRLLTWMVCAYGGLFLGMWVQQLSGVGDGGDFHLAGGRGLAEFPGRRFDPGRPLPARASESTGRGHSASRTNSGKRCCWGCSSALIFLPLGWGLQQASALVMTHLPHLKMEPEEQLSVHVLRVSIAIR